MEEKPSTPNAFSLLRYQTPPQAKLARGRKTLTNKSINVETKLEAPQKIVQAKRSEPNVPPAKRIEQFPHQTLVEVPRVGKPGTCLFCEAWSKHVSCKTSTIKYHIKSDTHLKAMVKVDEMKKQKQSIIDI
jgi:hypothetical protein